MKKYICLNLNCLIIFWGDEFPDIGEMYYTDDIQFFDDNNETVGVLIHLHRAGVSILPQAPQMNIDVKKEIKVIPVGLNFNNSGDQSYFLDNLFLEFPRQTGALCEQDININDTFLIKKQRHSNDVLTAVIKNLESFEFLLDYTVFDLDDLDQKKRFIQYYTNELAAEDFLMNCEPNNDACLNKIYSLMEFGRNLMKENTLNEILRNHISRTLEALADDVEFYLEYDE